MDAFFASVEQRDFPELRGKPVVVGRPVARGVIAAASYEARKYGVFSAMPSMRALQKCPNLIFQPHRFEVYKKVSNQIHQIFHEYTDLVEPLSLDEAFLDVTHNKKGISSATQIAKEIKEKIKQETQLTASAGVSYNKFLAKIASDYKKPDGLFVIKPSQAKFFLDELDLGKFFGIGKVTATKLKEKGLLKGKDLAKLSLKELGQFFGKNGLFFYNIVRGIDLRPVVSERIRKSVSVENTYEIDLKTKFAVITELYRLEKRLMSDIERLDVKGRTVTLKIRFNNFKTLTRSKTLSVPTNSYEDIQKASRALLKEIELGEQGIRLIGIGISNLFDNHQTENLQLEMDF